jgi:hypothetical protein
MRVSSFPTPFVSLNVGLPRTLVEQRMNAFSQAARNKPGWASKLSVHGDDWRSGMSSDLSPAAADYVMAELAWYASQRVPCLASCLEPGAVDGTWQADGLVPDETGRALMQGVRLLEAGPVDWHPHSGEIVRDLVHPSLYCLAYGKSRARPRLARFPSSLTDADVEEILGFELAQPPVWEESAFRARLLPKAPPPPLALEPTEGADYSDATANPYASVYASVYANRFGIMTDEQALMFENIIKHNNHTNSHIGEEINNFTSTSYAWLPSEFQIDSEGRASILTYINNLHPSHRELYEVIAGVFTAQVPLFERVLGELASKSRRLRVEPNWEYKTPSLSEWLKANNETLISVGFDPEELEATLGFCPEDEGFTDLTEEKLLAMPIDDDLFSGCDFDNRMAQWLVQKEPSPFETPAPMPELYSLKGRRLQVIVKLANIELTPEKPEYRGGVWHVEGMFNERIVATGIYYYSLENVTAPDLSFREAVDDPNYEQSDEVGVEVVHGLHDEDPLVQVLGAVETRPGRCLVFPNIFQHKVGPCELIDRTKSGKRRILAFFLVDPTHRAVSTGDVPPQQPAWFLSILCRFSPLFMLLPPEIIAIIASLLEYPMSIAAAHEYREELMAERSSVDADVSGEIFEREFSLCEH